MAGKPKTKEEVELWFREKAPHFQVIEYSGHSKTKSKFLDTRTNKQFEYRTDRLKIEIYNHPNCYPGCTKEERIAHRIATNLERYGSKSPLGNETIKQKANQTNLERYGSENVFNLEKFQEKAQNTLQKKYGVNCSSKIPTFKDTFEKNYFEKTGYKNPSNNPEVVEKRKATFKEKYDGTCSFDSPEIIEKIKRSNKDSVGVEYHNQLPGEANRRAAKANLTKVEQGKVMTFQGKLLSEIAKEKDYSYNTILKFVKDHGFDDLEFLQKEKSDIEAIMQKILEELHITDFVYERILKDEYHQYRTDFFIESHKLIIECDGLWWHSEVNQEDKKYHWKKKKFYNEKGYSSLFFRADEIYNKQEIIKSIIKNKMNFNRKIGARQCDIKQISKRIAKRFFRDNHLMGSGRGITYALFYENEIAAAGAFQWKNKDKKILDISRFCTRSGISVMGGYSRLINKAIEEFNPNTVQTYVDQRYGNGSYLAKFGFTLERNEPSFSWTDFKEVIYRNNIENPTEALKEGYVRIWDCGQARWDMIVNQDKWYNKP